MYYRVIFCDYSMENDNVGVIELAHDGCLLQEPDSVQLCCSQLELFDGHHHWPRGRLPHPLVDSSKLTRAKMLRQPANERESHIELAPPLPLPIPHTAVVRIKTHRSQTKGRVFHSTANSCKTPQVPYCQKRQHYIIPYVVSEDLWKFSVRQLIIEQASRGGRFPVEVIVAFNIAVCIGHQLYGMMKCINSGWKCCATCVLSHSHGWDLCR